MKIVADITQQLQRVRVPHVLCFALLMLSTDLVFLGLHIVQKYTGALGTNLYLISVDRGYAELFQFIKDFWIILLLLSRYLKAHEWGYIAWSLVFGFLLCDDALRIHEHAGVFLADVGHFPSVLGLRGRDFGELAFTACAATGILGLIGFSYWRGSKDFRAVTLMLIAGCVCIGIFGVFIDLLHMPFDGSLFGDILEMLEDGGEMFVISAIAAYVFGLATTDTRAAEAPLE